MTRFILLLFPALLLISHSSAQNEASPEERMQTFVESVARGEGYMPWQPKGLSEEEIAFRKEIEDRKTEMLESAPAVNHPVLLGEEEIARAQSSIEAYPWAEKIVNSYRAIADHVASQPDGYIAEMVPALTPTNGYGFTCPNCVGRKSQEGTGTSLVKWDYRSPDVLACRICGHVYPSPDYPETAVLKCPRTQQEFTYYLNDEERAHPEDRSGQYAWHWVGYPIHVSFTGILRLKKIEFMLGTVKPLALTYAFTKDPRYAETARDVLIRLAECYPRWLYHDYWDTIADCDPLYAAWHDKDLSLEWKRHLSTSMYKKDTPERAAMLQSYWGAGRVHPSTDGVSRLKDLCLAYDLVVEATGEDGTPVWTPEQRSLVERDLLLEWVIGAEPFVGGRGKADCHNNKAPRIYHAQAAVARCLGIPELADVALRGYEAVRDRSFLYDGFSTESPAYTNMYLSQLIEIPETLLGFQWPEGIPGREGVEDPYRSDKRLELMYRAVIDQLTPTGHYAPLSDTNVSGAPSQHILEIGRKRYPAFFSERLPISLSERSPSEYALFHHEIERAEQEGGADLPEIYFPAWMTAFLRHGTGPQSTILSMSFCPPGGHRHSDNLSLYYLDGGATMLGDHGYVGDMPVNKWIHSTRSHNLVVVDDQEQKHRGKDPRKPSLRMMATSPRVSVVEAESDAYGQCSQYRRLAALVKGPDAHTFAIDVFRVKGGKKHAFRIFSELASSDSEGGELQFTDLEIPPEAALPEVGNSLKHEDIFGLRDIRQVLNPPSVWQATWKEEARSYRLWMLSPADSVEASNGPGQESLRNAGRRVRYVDSIREGEDLSSVFVAIHEPSAPDGGMPIRSAARLEVTDSAGPDAVALKVESDWGTYTALAGFSEEAEVDGVRFQGDFGIVCKTPGEGAWHFAVGAETLYSDDSGFEGKTARWKGEVAQNTETAISAKAPCPHDWPEVPEGCQCYVLVNDGSSDTGFPVAGVEENEITVTRFPLPQVSDFDLSALRYEETGPR